VTKDVLTEPGELKNYCRTLFFKIPSTLRDKLLEFVQKEDNKVEHSKSWISEGVSTWRPVIAAWNKCYDYLEQQEKKIKHLQNQDSSNNKLHINNNYNNNILQTEILALPKNDPSNEDSSDIDEPEIELQQENKEKSTVKIMQKKLNRIFFNNSVNNEVKLTDASPQTSGKQLLDINNLLKEDIRECKLSDVIEVCLYKEKLIDGGAKDVLLNAKNNLEVVDNDGKLTKDGNGEEPKSPSKEVFKVSPKEENFSTVEEPKLSLLEEEDVPCNQILIDIEKLGDEIYEVSKKSNFDNKSICKEHLQSIIDFLEGLQIDIQKINKVDAFNCYYTILEQIGKLVDQIYELSSTLETHNLVTCKDRLLAVKEFLEKNMDQSPGEEVSFVANELNINNNEAQSAALRAKEARVKSSDKENNSNLLLGEILFKAIEGQTKHAVEALSNIQGKISLSAHEKQGKITILESEEMEYGAKRKKKEQKRKINEAQSAAPRAEKSKEKKADAKIKKKGQKRKRSKAQSVKKSEESKHGELPNKKQKISSGQITHEEENQSTVEVGSKANEVNNSNVAELERKAIIQNNTLSTNAQIQTKYKIFYIDNNQQLFYIISFVDEEIFFPLITLNYLLGENEEKCVYYY
jgi:hypothetical protein